ncbi:SDR family NAD(P)-dependent oxidoreductase [Acinetobacter modestus]|uniref:SDR family NAD(P)-dependent oxidoreductase n=1 Tax=Acinetobacter modestus TaxID=1776740 RepID=UPI00320A4D5E
MSKYHLKDKVIVITGSTGGLGLAVAQALRNKGAKLALLDLNLNQINAQANALGERSVAAGWVADVCSLESLETAMSKIMEHFGQIDVVIAAAGIASIDALEHIDPDHFESTININLNGVFRTFRAAIPYVKKTQGYLVAISSMAAFVHGPLNAHYAASKAGVWALCDSLRLELKNSNVAVGSFHPTFFQTPMMDSVQADPLGKAVWKGNTGIWKFVPIEEVVANLIAGIEKRQDLIVVPKSNIPVAKAPTLFRQAIEVIGFNQKELKEIMQMADNQR